MLLFFFFFFQAEDGIRDLTVTGVQTCALPICDPEHPGLVRIYRSDDPHSYENTWHCDGLWRPNPAMGAVLRCIECPPIGGDTRSEERRVGKECRSRWSPYH